MTTTTNKQKIINDPVYGFITIKDELIFDLIEHPFLQRLRRIKQLGLSDLVYPNANHNRFSHTLGALFLLSRAIETLEKKNIEITEEEKIAVKIAILLHDIGHSPFSHSLEHQLVKKTSHEDLSLLTMQKINRQFDGKLSLAIQIFTNQYPKKWLHQLVSSQLDMDRLDYLSRDSFFTGVSEGIVGTERIINMLNVKDSNLVVEEKGIYSIEKFIISRRLMYWQVYLHKTVVAAEHLLVKIINRARELAANNTDLKINPRLLSFLKNDYAINNFVEQENLLDEYMNIDDYDILACIKTWQYHHDPILSQLSKNIINRKLPKIIIQNQPFETKLIENRKSNVMNKMNIPMQNLDYYVYTGELKNHAYNYGNDQINILFKNGTCCDIGDASDQLNKDFLEKEVRKYFLCFPKEIL